MLPIDHTYTAQAKDARQRFLVLHDTDLDFSESIQILTKGEVSAHYLLPTLRQFDTTYPNDQLYVYQLVPESERAWHAGDSYWAGRTCLNDSSIGIEVVNLSANEFLPYPGEQIAVLIELCKDILGRYPDIPPQHVLGHSDIAVGRKKDPGPLFPWHRLYEHGIGAWFDPEAVASYMKQFRRCRPNPSEVLRKLNDYGYYTKGDQTDLLKAFQMHFRPCDYSGILDVETAAVVYALCDKYIQG